MTLRIGRQQLLALLALWLCFSTAQTAHFYFYYEQPLHLSLEWGFRDWFVWFCLVIGVRFALERTGLTFSPDIRGIAVVALIGAACGWLQILTLISLDFLTMEPSRPFVEDVLHLYQKRWLQNMLVFGLLWVLVGHLLSKVRNPVSAAVADKQPDDMIRITADGDSHWLRINDIRRVEVAGNYVCVETDARRYIARSTLTQIETKLPESRFLRISRACLVNRLFVVSCNRISRSRIELRLSGGQICTIGRTYWPSVRESLDL